MQKAKLNWAVLALLTAFGLSACGSDDNGPSTRPNQPGNDTTSQKQQQIDSELKKAKQQLEAENKTALDAAFKELEAADKEQREAAVLALSKEYDKTTPEGRAALEKAKTNYLAAADLQLTRDKALKEEESLKNLNEALAKLQADDQKKREAELAQIAKNHDTATAEGQAALEKAKAEYQTAADAALKAQKQAAETQNKAARDAALKQLEADSQKQREAQLAGLEKQYDQTTPEGQAALAAATQKLNTDADTALANLKKQKEGELQLESDKKLKQTEAYIEKKAVFAAYTFGVDDTCDEKGNCIHLIKPRDESSKNTERDINLLVVDGLAVDGPGAAPIKIELPQSKDLYYRDSNGRVVSNHLSFARYGSATMSEYYTSNNDDNRIFLFFQGASTRDMPTAGTAEYRGHTLLSEFIDEHEWHELGQSAFTVDFGKKNLQGNLDVHANPLQFNAGIEGNRFSGAQDSYQIEGGFFGPEAAELAGGAFKIDDGSKFFIFGAEKQK